MPLFINNRSIVIRMRLLMKIVVLFCLLTVVYQYSECLHFSKSSELEQSSIKLPYSQILIGKRSVDKKKLAPYNDIVGVGSSNVAAYSNGNDTYYSNENSYLYGTYMGLKWQCVEYARRWTFLRKSSVFASVVGASNMWDQLKYVERVADKQKFPLKRHPNGSPTLPTNESYLIYPIQKDMPFGHVAVIVDVLPNAIRIAEQNFYFHYWPHNYARKIPFVFRNGLYYIEDQYEVYGWMEIDDNKQLKPLDELTATKIQMKNERILDSSSFSFFHRNIHIYYCFLFVVLFISHFMFS